MNRFLKKIARFILGDYSLYYIYRWDWQAGPVSAYEHDTHEVHQLDDVTLTSFGDSLMQEQVGYLGPQSRCFGCFLNNQLVGVCFYWSGDRYRKRNFWHLNENEAKLVQIVVKHEMRGHGVATTLIRRSALEMANQGFVSLYARIWHSNSASLRAFKNAGWRPVAFVAEINPFRTTRPIRVKKVF